MKTIRIKGQDIPLRLTVGAYREICELCGSIDKLGGWLGGDRPTERLKKIITIMAEAAQKMQGTEGAPIEFPVYFSAAEITGGIYGVFKEIEQAFYHEIPENVKTKAADGDIDLETIRERRAKEKGIKRPNKALSVIATGLECGLCYQEILDSFTPGEITQIWLLQLSMKGAGNG